MRRKRRHFSGLCRNDRRRGRRRRRRRR